MRKEKNRKQKAGLYDTTSCLYFSETACQNASPCSPQVHQQHAAAAQPQPSSPHEWECCQLTTQHAALLCSTSLQPPYMACSCPVLPLHALTPAVRLKSHAEHVKWQDDPTPDFPSRIPAKQSRSPFHLRAQGGSRQLLHQAPQRCGGSTDPWTPQGATSLRLHPRGATQARRLRLLICGRCRCLKQRVQAA